MAGKLSELTPKTTAVSADYVEIFDSEEANPAAQNKSLTLDKILSLAGLSGVTAITPSSADYAVTTITFDGAITEDDTLTINNVTYTCKDLLNFVEGANHFTGNDTNGNNADSLKRAIEFDWRARTGGELPDERTGQGAGFVTVASNVVTVVARKPGERGNTIAVSKTGAANITLLGANFTLGAGDTTINFTTGQEVQTIIPVGNLALKAAGLAAGKKRIVKITTDANARSLSFPYQWKFLGFTGRPDAISANSLLELHIVSSGTTDDDVSVIAVSNEVLQRYETDQVVIGNNSVELASDDHIKLNIKNVSEQTALHEIIRSMNVTWKPGLNPNSKNFVADDHFMIPSPIAGGTIPEVIYASPNMVSGLTNYAGHVTNAIMYKLNPLIQLGDVSFTNYFGLYGPDLTTAVTVTNVYAIWLHSNSGRVVFNQNVELNATVTDNNHAVNYGLVKGETYQIVIPAPTAATLFKIPLKIRDDCTIRNVSVVGTDASDSVSIEVWKGTQGSLPPTVTDKISASAPLTLSSEYESTDATLTGWSKSLIEDEYLYFYVVTASVAGEIMIYVKTDKV